MVQPLALMMTWGRWQGASGLLQGGGCLGALGGEGSLGWVQRHSIDALGASDAL